MQLGEEGSGYLLKKQGAGSWEGGASFRATHIDLPD